MARCPECGGSVGPLDYAGLRPRTVRCQWCNARLELPRGTRRLRDAVLVVFGGAGTVGGYVLWRTSGDPLWLIVGASGLLAGIVLGLAIEQIARPVTRAGRSVSPVSSPRVHEDRPTEPTGEATGGLSRREEDKATR